MTSRKAKPEGYLRGIFEKPADSKVYWVRYVDGSGNYKREKVGTKTNAIKLLAKRKSDALAGVKLPENLRHRGITFGQLAASIDTYVEAHHAQVKDVRIRVKRLLPTFGEQIADQITPALIDEWLVKNTLTPATANRYRSTFSLIYREAIRNGKVTTNPARMVRQRPENNGRIRCLSDDEQQRLVSAINNRFPKHLPELLISLGTGMRLSEQYGLLWGHVNLSTKTVHLTKTKNGLSRSIPMNDSVYEAFLTMRGVANDTNPDTRIFPIKDAKTWFAYAMKDAGLTGYRWHDNRHTFCSRLARKNLNLKVIQELAGHKTIQMSAKYSHMNDTSKREAVSQI